MSIRLLSDFLVSASVTTLVVFGLMNSGCASKPKTEEFSERSPVRSTASDSGEFARHIQTLQTIPIVRPIENPDTDENSIADQIGNTFKNIQKESTSTTKGKIERGTHAKGSCFSGSFRNLTNDELSKKFSDSPATIARLRRGIFGIDGTFPAKIRFANAAGPSSSDVVGDVRGFSFVVDFEGATTDFAGENRQDFMLNNTPMFAVNNAHEFFELLKTLRLKNIESGDGESHAVNPLYAQSILKAVKFAAIYQKPDTVSYAYENYWSNLPYTHGVDSRGQPIDLVKFKAVRCDGQPTQRSAAEGKADNYLQTDIAQLAQAGQICFLIQAQFFDLKKAQSQPPGQLKSSHPNWSTSEWIENGGENWDESVMPFQTVAKVDVANGNSQISCDDWYVNTRLHSNPANQPLGSVARVRTLIEEQSRARRMGR